MENKNEKRLSNYLIDEQQQCPSSHARSFTCAFCKKGFSNAQALGGHMNIHRKARAKLKQQAASDENLLSLDVTKATPIEQQQQQSQVISEVDKNLCLNKDKSPRKVCKDEDQEVKQFTLFVEMPSTSDHHDMKEISSNCVSRGSEEIVTNQSSSKEELDLELRLAGPDPRR